ncbi:MAG: prolyl oligopeptidase family serine peptidase [Cellvibrionaceae bacterium]
MNKTNITHSSDTQENPKTKNAAYGSWKSPITASLLTKANSGLSEPQFDGKDIYWLESRPLEKGRNCIVKLDNEGNKKDILPAPLNARSRVNEYGGGSYCVNDGIIYFVLFDDQRIYSIDTQQVDLDGKLPSPLALTPEDKNIRFGDLAFDPIRKKILAVCEDHSPTTNKKKCTKEPDTYIVAITPNKNHGETSPDIILSGEDFYSNPSVSPNGQKITWLSWNHPNMPWDETACWIADINQEGKLSNIKKVAGEKNESIFQPTWSPDNTLYFSPDKNNWWNIYAYDPYSKDRDYIKIVYDDEAEYATPQWVFGLKTFDFLDSKTILTTYTKNGFWLLAKIHITENHEHNTKEDIKIESTDIGYISAHNGRGIFIGANSKSFESLFLYENNKKNNTINPISVVSRSGSLSIDDGYLSHPESISFPITSTTSVTDTGHAFFYPPKNNDYQSQSDSNKSKLKPPLLVFCHGGPTAATHSSLNLKIQYWTSRGFAVADVNYGGSTGYGRHYRDRLKNQWGIVDVQDTIDCVKYLSNENKIDSEKTAIRGGSAGGYTVLSALTFHNVFKAGTSLYGIGDLETLATDTHKFESRYLDQLVGPYPADKQTYQDRSPINFVEQLNCPVLFLQGLKDKVVPPNQAEAMIGALDKQKIAVAYVTFADEGHGFRQAKNIQHALESELYFYSKVFNFPLVEDIKPINIKHIDNAHR